jgi:hypothetical protein
VQTAVVATALILSATSTAGPEEDELQYVVRAGIGKPAAFEAGSRMTSNGYGFSVQTARNVSIDELARGGAFKNKQTSVSTVQQLMTLGLQVNFPTPGQGEYHGTVIVPNPPPPGIFNAISGAFRPRTNPYPAQ